MAQLQKSTVTERERWALEADRYLVMYSGWLYNYEPPAEVGDAWFHFVLGVKAMLGPDAGTHEVNWPRVWGEFTDDYLVTRDDYRLAVERQSPKISIVMRGKP